MVEDGDLGILLRGVSPADGARLRAPAPERTITVRTLDEATGAWREEAEDAELESTWEWVFKPAAQRAEVGWAGFHTLRHTAGTTFFRAGWNAKQVQMVLGHHSPAFTLETYVPLLPDDSPDPGFLDESMPSAPPRDVRVACGPDRPTGTEDAEFGAGAVKGESGPRTSAVEARARRPDRGRRQNL